MNIYAARKDEVKEAVTNAEAHLNNVGLPSYSAVLLALENLLRECEAGPKNDYPTLRPSVGTVDAARKALDGVVEKDFEFAVEFGWRFESFTVKAADAKAARKKLWNEVLTDAQRNCVSDIELVEH
jgi:hypothetical protein